MSKKTVAELKLQNNQTFTDNNANEIEGLQHNSMNANFIDSLVHKDELKTMWVNDVSDIRALEGYADDVDVGCFLNKVIYEFNENSTDTDDGYKVLKPNDLISTESGRWIFRFKIISVDFKNWKNDNAEIRQIKHPENEQIIGNFNNNMMFVFDSSTSFEDNGTTILIADDGTNGNWIKKVQFADRNQVVNQLQDSILGVDDTSGYYKSPYAATGNPAFKILDKNDNIGAYFTDDGLLRINKIKPLVASAYLYLGEYEKTYLSGSSLFHESYLYIQNNGASLIGEIRFNNSPGYPHATLRDYKYNALAVGLELTSNIRNIDQSSISISPDGHFSVNMTDRRFLFGVKNTEYPTMGGLLSCVNGSKNLTISNTYYSSFLYDFQIGGSIKVGTNTYIIESYTAGATNTIVLTSPFSEPDGYYDFYLTDRENKLTLTRFGYLRLANNAQIAEERLDVSDTTKIQGLRLASDVKTSDFDFEKVNHTILLDANSNTVTGTLPEITEKWDGQIFVIKCIDATNTATINCSGTNLIDEIDVSTKTLALDEKLKLQANLSLNKWIQI